MNESNSRSVSQSVIRREKSKERDRDSEPERQREEKEKHCMRYGWQLRLQSVHVKEQFPSLRGSCNYVSRNRGSRHSARGTNLICFLVSHVYFFLGGAKSLWPNRMGSHVRIFFLGSATGPSYHVPYTMQPLQVRG